jgi:Holliday junction resolvasome RuvABC endonuclease subunit
VKHDAATAAMLAGEEDDALSIARPVLGLDPGLNCGWCLYHPDLAPTFGLEQLSGGDLGAQLHHFAGWLGGMLHLHRPAALALERPFGRATFTSDIPGAVCSVAHMVAHACGTRRIEFVASSVKKAMTGSGTATKGDVIAAVRAKFAVLALSSHEADAAAVAVMGWAREAQR